MPAPTSILVVASSPDGRPSTESLRQVAAELGSRPGVVVAVWFLRRDPERGVWPGASVVDDLRTWGPAVALDRWSVGLGNRLRGLRLRRWLTRTSPAVVILDDGLGARVLAGRRRPLLVARRNAGPVPRAAADEPAVDRADLVLLAPGAVDDLDPAAPRLLVPLVADHAPSRRAAAPEQRALARSVLRLPAEAPLVAGFDDGRGEAGARAFVGVLGQAASGAEDPPHGVWFGPALDPGAEAALEEHAAEAGLAGRFHHRPVATLELQQCVDVVLVTDAARADGVVLRAALAGGLAVVAPPRTGEVDEALFEGEGPDELAAVLRQALALAPDRHAGPSSSSRFDVRVVVDELLAAVASASADAR